MEQAPKKGMSKGCMIGLIIAGVIVVLVAALAITCWVYKEDLAKKGATVLVESVRTSMTEESLEGVDKQEFDALADAFVAKMDSSDIDLDKLGLFMQNIQGIMADREVDASETQDLIDAMINYYPELEHLRPVPVEADTELEELPAETE